MNLMKSMLVVGMRKRWPGFGFMTSKIYPQGIITNTKHGVRLQLDPYQAVEGTVLFDGYFDESVLNTLIQHLKPGEVFWDVGANVGLHTFTVKKLLPTVQCLAFEPFYKNFERLCVNQSLNPELKIEKYNMALASKTAIETQYTSDNNAGRTSLQPLPDARSTEIYINTIRGDDLIDLGLPKPHVMKLDTEGTELKILQGCSRLLTSSNLRLIIYETFSQQKEIDQYLTEFGFSITPIDTLSNFMAIR